MTSQAENREVLKSVLIVIMTKYLFEFNGFIINLVNLGTLPVTSQAPFPSIQLGQGSRRGSPTIGFV